MKLLLFCAVVLWNLSSSVIECNTNGVFTNIAGGDNALGQALEAGTRLGFELIKGGTVMERGFNMIERINKQQQQDKGCEKEMVAYLSRFFVTKAELNTVLVKAFDAYKDAHISTYLTKANGLNSGILTTASNPQVSANTRLRSYGEYANQMAEAALNIITMAGSTSTFGGDIDLAFIWVAKALSHVKLAYEAALTVMVTIKQVYAAGRTFDRDAIHYAYDQVKACLVHMINFDTKFWDKVMWGSVKKFWTEKHYSLSVKGISGTSVTFTKSWSKENLFQGWCRTGYKGWVECHYNSPVHSVNKGPIIEPHIQHWHDKSELISKTECNRRHNGDGTNVGTWGLSTRLDSGSSNGYYKKGQSTIGMRADQFCPKNDANERYNEALWYYECDDFYKFETLYMETFFKTSQWNWYRHYESHSYKFWWQWDFQAVLNQVDNMQGMLITADLWNYMIDADQAANLGKMSGRSKFGQKNWGYGGSNEPLEHQGKSIGRRKLAELNEILGSKTSEEIAEDEELLESIIELDSLAHLGYRPPTHPKKDEDVEDAKELENVPDDFVETMRMLDALGDEEVVDADIDNMIVDVDGDDMQTDVDDPEMLVNVDEEEDIRDAMEEALAKVLNQSTLAETNQNWNYVRMAVCFSIGAGLVYVYKSYHKEEKLSVTYGLMEQEI